VGAVRLGPRSAAQRPVGAVGWPERAARQRAAGLLLRDAVAGPRDPAPRPGVTGRPEAAGRPGAVRWVGPAGRPVPGGPVGRPPPPGYHRSQAGVVAWESAGVRRSWSAEPTYVPGRRPWGAAERSGPAESRRRRPPARRPGRFRSRPPERPASPRTPWSRGRVRRAPGRRRRPVGWALARDPTRWPAQASSGAHSAVRPWAARAGSAASVGPGGRVGPPGGIAPPGAAKPNERASMPASATRHRHSTHPATPAATRRGRRVRLVARRTRARGSSALARMPPAGSPGRRARPMPSGTRPAPMMGPRPPAGSMEGRSCLRPATAGVRRPAGAAWMEGWLPRPGPAAGWLGRMKAVRGSRGGLAPLLGPTGPAPARSARPACPVEAAGRPRAGPGPVRRPGWRASGPRGKVAGSRPRWPAYGCRGGR
jgi:hypothetical protein